MAAPVTRLPQLHARSRTNIRTFLKTNPIPPPTTNMVGGVSIELARPRPGLLLLVARLPNDFAELVSLL